MRLNSNQLRQIINEVVGIDLPRKEAVRVVIDVIKSVKPKLPNLSGGAVRELASKMVDDVSGVTGESPYATRFQITDDKIFALVKRRPVAEFDLSFLREYLEDRIEDYHNEAGPDDPPWKTMQWENELASLDWWEIVDESSISVPPPTPVTKNVGLPGTRKNLPRKEAIRAVIKVIDSIKPKLPKGSPHSVRDLVSQMVDDVKEYTGESPYATRFNISGNQIEALVKNRPVAVLDLDYLREFIVEDVLPELGSADTTIGWNVEARLWQKMLRDLDWWESV